MSIAAYQAAFCLHLSAFCCVFAFVYACMLWADINT